MKKLYVLLFTLCVVFSTHAQYYDTFINDGYKYDSYSYDVNDEVIPEVLEPITLLTTEDETAEYVELTINGVIYHKNMPNNIEELKELARGLAQTITDIDIEYTSYKAKVDENFKYSIQEINNISKSVTDIDTTINSFKEDLYNAIDKEKYYAVGILTTYSLFSQTLSASVSIDVNAFNMVIIKPLIGFSFSNVQKTMDLVVGAGVSFWIK